MLVLRWCLHSHVTQVRVCGCCARVLCLDNLLIATVSEREREGGREGERWKSELCPQGEYERGEYFLLC